MPGSQTILGVASVCWNRTRRDYDPSRGMTTTYFYEGTKDAVENLAATLGGVEHSVEHNNNPPISTLQIVVPGLGENSDPNAIQETQFELLGNTGQKSGYEHRKSIAIPITSIDLIKSAVKANREPTTTLTGDANTLYEHMKRGQDSFVCGQFVFRATFIIGRLAVVPIAMNDTERVFTSANMMLDVGSMPTIYTTAINGAYSRVYNEIYEANPPTGFTVGWLKQLPTITTVAGGKSAISLEYWLDAWSDYYYAD